MAGQADKREGAALARALVAAGVLAREAPAAFVSAARSTLAVARRRLDDVLATEDDDTAQVCVAALGLLLAHIEARLEESDTPATFVRRLLRPVCWRH